jgi:hypothetical protein
VRLATSRQAQHVRRLREVLSLAIQAPELATAGLDQHKFHRLFAIGAIGRRSIFAHKLYPVKI